MKRYLLVVLLLYIVKLNAQIDTIPLPAVGFVQNLITDLLIDNSDQYWLTSNGQGVKKYDGNSWISIPVSNKVYTVKQGPSGDYWFGTNIGLVKYDLVDTTVYNTTNSGIPSNGVLALCFDNNDLWLGTINGLSKYDGSNWTNYNSDNSSLDCDTINGI
ncbi:MAG TPA: two-component regulator propeller domain-containing protein, partial [Bacteroidia bacterium]